MVNRVTTELPNDAHEGGKNLATTVPFRIFTANKQNRDTARQVIMYKSAAIIAPIMLLNGNPDEGKLQSCQIVVEKLITGYVFIVVKFTCLKLPYYQ